MPRKKKILIHSNGHNVFTGFGKNIKNVLTYLQKTGKYELIEAANESPCHAEWHRLLPWTRYGTLPQTSTEVNSKIAEKPNDRNWADSIGKMTAYGYFGIDSIVAQTKPDVYIGIEDVWAFDGYPDKHWWNKCNCMIWTTLDSLPMLPKAIEIAQKTPNFYVWSEFAEKAIKKDGVGHAKTLHGMVDCSHFYPLDKEKKLQLRNRHSIPDDVFFTGFVFRNQLRKTVGDLIEGLALFKKNNPQKKAKILLHTSWQEGWNIPFLCKEFGVSLEDVLTTYHCSKCGEYSVQNHIGENKDCPHCKNKSCFSTTNIRNGVSEGQLNEIYNLMDLYCHPMTSGGQEIPIQEAKLAGLITAVTNYSCGEEMCTEEAQSIPLSWSKYKEVNTCFTKASTSADDIRLAMEFVLGMTEEKRQEYGKGARDFIIKNYSVESVGKKLEEVLDSMPFVEDYGFSFLDRKYNLKYEPDPQTTILEFVTQCFKNILGLDLWKGHREIDFWVKRLSTGGSRDEFYRHILSMAQKELNKKHLENPKNFIKEDGLKKLALIVPTDALLAFSYSCFLKSLKETYSNHKLYVFCAPSLTSFFRGFEEVDELLPILDWVSDRSLMEGSKDKEGLFDLVFYPPMSELAYPSYAHGGKDRTQNAPI